MAAASMTAAPMAAISTAPMAVAPIAAILAASTAADSMVTKTFVVTSLSVTPKLLLGWGWGGGSFLLTRLQVSLYSSTYCTYAELMYVFMTDSTDSGHTEGAPVEEGAGYSPVSSGKTLLSRLWNTAKWRPFYVPERSLPLLLCEQYCR
jgi:hypothetical protein